MNRETYERLESHMRSQMNDSAHDTEHVYRVLYAALDIAAHEDGVDYGVLIAACLLHDIGRQEQYETGVCHAAAGAEKAHRFLTEQGFGQAFAKQVAACIRTHRYRGGSRPESLEAKILYDADKLDVTGAIGIARTLLYQGQVGEPLYSLASDGRVSDGAGDKEPSFFEEYKGKLEKIYAQFYTKRGAEAAAGRRKAAEAFYGSLLEEVRPVYETGSKRLNRALDSAAR